MVHGEAEPGSAGRALGIPHKGGTLLSFSVNKGGLTEL